MMIEANRYARQADGDRKDQAIGRIVRLISSMSLKELDAMADRLGLGLVTPCDRRSGQSDASPPQIEERPYFATPSTTQAELHVDTIGQ